MENARTVRLFRNGRNQAVRIPRAFEMPGDKAVIRKDGGRLILEPAERKSLLAVLAEMSPARTGIQYIGRERRIRSLNMDRRRSPLSRLGDASPGTRRGMTARAR